MTGGRDRFYWSLKRLEQVRAARPTEFGLMPRFAQAPGQEAFEVAGWTPAVSISERQDEYLLVLEAPGAAEEDLAVEVQGDTVIVSGLRLTCEEAPCLYHTRERAQGAFQRAFRFDVPIDFEKASSRLALGELTVRLPKARPGGAL
jgi:HSP20 family protein